MSKIFYLKIANEKTGLCNQIYSLASAICCCIKYNKNIIIISMTMVSDTSCCGITYDWHSGNIYDPRVINYAP